MDEYEIDDSIDKSFSTNNSIDSFELSKDVFDVMDSVEVPTIEDNQFESIESGIEDYSYEETNVFSDEVIDVMDGAQAEELAFDDDLMDNTFDGEILESEMGQQIEEPTSTLLETMDGIEPEVLEFDEQIEDETKVVEHVEEPYEAVPNSEIEILQENGSIDTLEHIQEQLESEAETIERAEEPYEAIPNSEIEILREDGSIDTLEHIQEQLESETETIERAEEPYEAIPNSEIEILQEDGSIDTLENIQEQIERDIEDFEYDEVNHDTNEVQEQLDPHEALSNMSEYMNAHNYGMEDYEIYSKDPEWQALNRDLQVANGIEPTEWIADEVQETMSEIPQREFDDFEQSVLERNPEFYETGSYYEQGVNEYGYLGTCGPTSQANAINYLLGTNDLTENKILSVAIDNNLCQTQGALDSCGGTSTEQFMELYGKMNEQLGDKFDAQLYEYGNVLDANQVAERLENGDVVNVAVDACALWDQPRDYTNALGVRQDDFYSDHWITVTGVERMDDGGIQGFDIIDSGGGESYVSLDKYNDMCFGTDEHRVIDPTCVVLSRNNGVDGQCVVKTSKEIDSRFDDNMNAEVKNESPSLVDWIGHRKGEK